jgi:ubiquinone/menaquinone biosynthesis C-methylase UbiE
MSFLTPHQLVQELYIRPGDRVVDIGCGTGVYTIELSHAVADIGQVFAVDVHREALQTLATTLEKKSIQNVEMVWADVELGIPVDAYSIDAVVISNVLFQIEDIDAMLTHVSKLLKPEGQLLVVEWSESHGGIGPHIDHVVSEKEAELHVQKHGFRVLKRLPAGDYHYAFIALAS